MLRKQEITFTTGLGEVEDSYFPLLRTDFQYGTVILD